MPSGTKPKGATSCPRSRSSRATAYGAIATPTPDPFSMLALLTPMVFLYGGAIVATAVLDRRKRVAERIAAGNGEDLP